MKSKKGKKLTEWQRIAKKGGVCDKCKREVSTLTVDHIIPIATLKNIDDTGQVI